MIGNLVFTVILVAGIILYYFVVETPTEDYSDYEIGDKVVHILSFIGWMIGFMVIAAVVSSLF